MASPPNHHHSHPQRRRGRSCGRQCRTDGAAAHQPPTANHAALLLFRSLDGWSDRHRLRWPRAHRSGRLRHDAPGRRLGWEEGEAGADELDRRVSDACRECGRLVERDDLRPQKALLGRRKREVSCCRLREVSREGLTVHKAPRCEEMSARLKMSVLRWVQYPLRDDGVVLRRATVRDGAIEIRVWRSPALISDFEGEIEPLPALNFFDFSAKSRQFFARLRRARPDF